MITIKEIAARLGVSPTTVSNVIHGNTREVSSTTIERVQKMVKETNYIPNMSARTLAQKSSKLIGLIVRYPVMEGKNVVQDPFNSELIGVIEQEVRKAGCFLILYASDNVDDILRMAITWNVQGLIVLGLGAKGCKKIKETADKPTVFIDCYFQDDESTYTNVGLKDRKYAKEMTQYLIDQGHKRILFLADNRVGVDYERWMGFYEAMCENDLPVSDASFKLIRYGELGIQQTYEEIYEKREDFTVLFFASDYYAVHAINYFYDKGMNVPDDMSVAGFDDNIFGRNIRPRLTTIYQNVAQKGTLAVSQLMKLIEKEPLEVSNIRLDAELKIRDTVRKL